MNYPPQEPLARLFPLDGSLWYLVAVHYPTAKAARRAWERAERARWRPNAGIGLVRLSAEAAAYDPALPFGRHPVVGVTTKPDSARDMALELTDGKPWVPSWDLQDWMIERRRQVVGTMEGAGGGRFRIRRPEPPEPPLRGRNAQDDIAREEP
jgi:hypothetical protein